MGLARDLEQTRDFFTPRAPGWEDRFAEDEPAFAWAVEQLGLSPGEVAVDAGCGTGRALVPLRDAVGPSGVVVGFDATPAMLDEATRLGRQLVAGYGVSDVACLPLKDNCAAGILAAGLLPHLSDPVVTLRELARVALRGARLGVFHPIGRLTLAGRHKDTDADDMHIAPARISQLLADSGWALQALDDAETHYMALAIYQG